MAIVQISKIQVRTGSKLELPVLSPGELGYATDTKQLYIGNVDATAPNENTEIKTTDAISLPGDIDSDTQVLYNFKGVIKSDETFSFDYESSTKKLNVVGNINAIADENNIGGEIRGKLFQEDIVGTMSIEKGGTGASTRQAAINALAGTLANNTVLRSNGVDVLLGKVSLDADVTGIVPIANGGTGKTSFTSGYITSDGTSLTSISTIPGNSINGNISGNATNITGVATVQHGGTGADNQQEAINNLSGTLVENTVLRSDGTNVILGKVNVSSDVTGILAIENGGTGANNAIDAINNLVPAQTNNQGKYLTTDGFNVNWVDIPLSSGTVSSVALSGGTTGLTTLGGPITSSGTITLGGVLGMANGGTGVSGFELGYIRSTGTSLVSSLSIPGSDIVGNISGKASNVEGVVSISNGGTGSYTQQDAINALVGSQTANTILRSDGSNVTLSKVNLETDVTGTVSIINGGTGITSYNKGDILFAADNLTLSKRAVGTTGQVLTVNTSGLPVWSNPVTGVGTVTSVAVSGGTTGLTISGGPITSSGTITLGGTLAIANGGTGADTRQAAINALAGTLTNDTVLRCNGTDVVLSKINASKDIDNILPIANGGTGSLTRQGAIDNLVPAQANNEGKYLTTDGTNVSWGNFYPTIEEIIPTDGQTVISTSTQMVAKINNRISIMVFLNGVLQREGTNRAYTVTGDNEITFNFELSKEDEVIIYNFN